MSTEPVTDDDRAEEEPLPLRPAHARVPPAVHRCHGGDAGQMPGRVERHLRRSLGRRRARRGLRAGPVGRVRVQRPRPGPRAARLQGHLDPDPRRGLPRRLPGDGPARAAALPSAAQPVPVAGRGGPLDTAGGRDRPRQPEREDRDRPDRLRRRPRQHRPRRAHPGDARDAAEELGHLRRADPRLGLHPAELAEHRAHPGGPDRHARRHGRPARADQGEPPARPDRRARARRRSTAPCRRTSS